MRIRHARADLVAKARMRNNIPGCLQALTGRCLIS
jgi:hypothetical protein